MGLDIIVYSNLKKNERISRMSDEDKGDLDFDYLVMSPRLMCIEDAFPGMAEPLKYNGDVYECDGYEFINIGSYGTYGWFRRALEAFSKDRDCFSELINFSDCEGVIGNVVSKKLYKDFSSNAESFKKWVHRKFDAYDSELLLQKYRKFEIAFKTAKDGGAVEFC